MDAFGEKPRLRSLLDHFAVIDDPREKWRVAHPLPEVLLLVVCASIASCDDFDDIAASGARRISTSCAASSPIIMACPVPDGSTS